ncbi:MAG: DUF4830 domain-containing protein [Clostridia bacterium]|nr:DUF4830 domain-containing protein [Clostridia bacterium]
MFVFSVKTSYRQVLSALGCVAVVAVAAVTAALLPEQAVVVSTTRVTSSEERVAYLCSLGVEITADSEEVREVRIPDEPDEVLLQYDALQETAGRSLTAYSGKRVRLYSYQTADGGEAHLYVYRDRIVAGDVERGGTMHPIG